MYSTPSIIIRVSITKVVVVIEVVVVEMVVVEEVVWVTEVVVPVRVVVDVIVMVVEVGGVYRAYKGQTAWQGTQNIQRAWNRLLISLSIMTIHANLYKAFTRRTARLSLPRAYAMSGSLVRPVCLLVSWATPPHDNEHSNRMKRTHLFHQQ